MLSAKKNASRTSLFSGHDHSFSANSKDTMKDLVFRLMADSPKTKMSYGTVRDALRKPFVVVSRSSHENLYRNSCQTGNRAPSSKGRPQAMSKDSLEWFRDANCITPICQSSEIGNISINDCSELSCENEDSSSEVEQPEVSNILETLFREADRDAKKNKNTSIRQCRKEIFSEQAERFASVTEQMKSVDLQVLSKFEDRKARLEAELSAAQHQIENVSCPTSPVAALINQMEEHRIGREAEFFNRLKTYHSETMRSSELERNRAEISLVTGKLQMIMQKISQLAPSNVPQLQENIAQINKNVEAKLSVLQSLSVESIQNDSFNQTLTENNKAVDDYINFLEEYEKLPKFQAAPDTPLANVPQQQPTPTVPSSSNNTIDFTAIEKKAKLFVEQWRARVKPFQEDQNFKQQRSDLQRGVFSLVNMLSSESELSARIPVKLDQLLSGNTVDIAGRSVTVQCHPLAGDFVKLAICKKFIGQAEEEVSSQPAVAMPLAKAVLPLLLTRPDMAELLISFFYSSCPLLIPVEVTSSEGNTDVDAMLEQLGYRKRQDGEYEGIERFLKRMSGITTLFSTMATIAVNIPPNGKRPITIAMLWMTLARNLQISPFPDLTPTVIVEILKVSSKDMHAKYGRQFDKMARVMKNVFLPNLNEESGSVSTLRHFLNTEVAAICNWPLAQK